MMMKDSAMQQHDSSSFEIIRNEKILEELKAEPEIDNSINFFSLIECAHKHYNIKPKDNEQVTIEFSLSRLQQFVCF